MGLGGPVDAARSEDKAFVASLIDLIDTDDPRERVRDSIWELQHVQKREPRSGSAEESHREDLWKAFQPAIHRASPA